MPFTVDETTARGKVRLLIGDTDTTSELNQIFTDAQIDAFLSLENSEVYPAAAAACEAIAASQSRTRVAERAIGEGAEHFRALADRYRERGFAEPGEEIDSMDYQIDRFGGDASEYVGDVI